MIQITGYEKYHNFMGGYGKHWQSATPDTVVNPDLINETPIAIRSAMWFWLTYKVYDAEHGHGILDVKKITQRVNGGNMGLEERKDAYKLAERVLK